MVKVKISDKTNEVLLTNLSKEEFATNDIISLYGKRWGIEISYNTLKNKIKIESFTGFLPNFIYQDFFHRCLFIIFCKIYYILLILN